MQLYGIGSEVITKFESIVKTELSQLQFSVTDAKTNADTGNWTQSIQLRRGTWTGVDIDLSQNKDTNTIDVEVSTASKGSGVLILVAIVLAIAISFLSGDPLLRAVGITAVTSNLTVALLALILMLVTVPVAMIAGRIIGASGVKESNALVEKVNQLLQPLAQ